MEYTFYTETKLTPVASSSSAASSQSLTQRNGGMAPKFVICYICGRKYGTQSITIHEKTCLEKFRRDNEALPPNLRRAEPKRPQAMQGVLVEQTVIGVGSQRGNAEANLDKLNQEALSSFQGTLVACPNCGRTFLPDRLEVHQRACNSLGGQTFKKGRGAGGGNNPRNKYQVRLVKREEGALAAEAAAKEAQFESTNKEVGAFVTCKMCGKAFMGHSLAIHQAQCVKHTANHVQQRTPGGARAARGGGGGGGGRSTGGGRVAPPSGWSGGGGGGGGGFSNDTPFGGGGSSSARAGPSGFSGGGGGMSAPPSGNNAAFRPDAGRSAGRSKRPF